MHGRPGPSDPIVQIAHPEHDIVRLGCVADSFLLPQSAQHIPLDVVVGLVPQLGVLLLGPAGQMRGDHHHAEPVPKTE